MMDMFYAASVDSFFNNEDSKPTKNHRCSYDVKRMRICMLYIILQLLAAVGPTLASLTPELYWKSKLPPTTLMPKSIAVLLHPPAQPVGGLNYSKKFHYGGLFFLEKDLKFAHKMKLPFEKTSNQTSFLPRQVVKSIPFSSTKVMSSSSSLKQFRYGRHGPYSETEPQDNPNTSDLFFLEKDLKFGHKMKFPFEKTSNQTSFLPRQVVKSIPFSSTKMAEIFNKFSVKPGSIEAEVMKSTIKDCEEPGIKGEDKYCATSLESMLDFTILKIGRHVQALSTEVMKKNKERTKQVYKITNGVKKVGNTNLVVCHKLSYVYAVFYCHKIEKTVAYTVLLEGANGSKVKAVSVCHRDTSQWNPNHLAFKMLKVKPGSIPICHFLFQDSIAWVRKQN